MTGWLFRFQYALHSQVPDKCLPAFLIAFFGFALPAWSVVPPVKLAGNAPAYTGTGLGGVAVSNTALLSEKVFVFQPGFDSTVWSGSLKKFAVLLDDASKQVKIAEKAEWDAASQLENLLRNTSTNPAYARKIFTSRFAADTAINTIEFKWEALSEQQKLFLSTSPVTHARDGLGAQRLNYLQGSRHSESPWLQEAFQNRISVLGSIVNSQPVYVGAPAVKTGEVGYQSFFNANRQRKAAVYVNANDGMLHAFDAQEGTELFAYVPNAVFPYLAQLSQPEFNHRFRMDAPVVVAEAQLHGSWKTILASGMGSWAQGVFALDVTDPATFPHGAGVLWEFTDQDDPEMGNVLNIPVIAKFKFGMMNGMQQYRYFLVVGGGINNYVDDGHFNPSGGGVLFLLALDKRPAEEWKLGANYFKFKTSISDSSMANGLSSPVLVLGDDGAVEHGYAGDLQGNLWRFNFTGGQPWVKQNAQLRPLFTATDDRQTRQPITAQPKVVFAPNGGYVVLFGTGKLLDRDDHVPANFAPQSFYAIYDTASPSYLVTNRSQLEPRKLSKTYSKAMQLTGQNFSYGEAPGRKRGWYVDFPDSEKTGERSVSNPVLASGQVFFNSLIPCASSCPHGGGHSYAFPALTGMPQDEKETARPSAQGMLKAPVLLETGTRIVKKNSLGKAIAKRTYVILHPGVIGNQGRLMLEQSKDNSDRTTANVPAMRLSWREILNWHEIRAASPKK